MLELAVAVYLYKRPKQSFAKGYSEHRVWFSPDWKLPGVQAADFKALELDRALEMIVIPCAEPLPH
jgi:hypothetical protein